MSEKSYAAFSSLLALPSQAVGLATANSSMLMSLLIPAMLFLLLTPGFIVNVGGISKGRCLKLIPFPSDADGVCTDGAYVDGSSGYSVELDSICIAQQKCHRWFISGYTGPWPVAIHTLAFLLLTGVLAYYMMM